RATADFWAIGASIHAMDAFFFAGSFVVTRFIGLDTDRMNAVTTNAVRERLGDFKARNYRGYLNYRRCADYCSSGAQFAKKALPPDSIGRRTFAPARKIVASRRWRWYSFLIPVAYSPREGFTLRVPRRKTVPPTAIHMQRRLGHSRGPCRLPREFPLY